MSLRFVRHPGRIGLFSLALSLATSPVWPANALPEMGNSVDEVLSRRTKRGWGAGHPAAAGHERAAGRSLVDRYLQSLGQRLVSQSTAAGDPFLFFAVRDGR